MKKRMVAILTGQIIKQRGNEIDNNKLHILNETMNLARLKTQFAVKGNLNFADRTLDSHHGGIRERYVRFLQERYQPYQRKLRHGSGLRRERGEQMLAEIVSETAGR